MQVELSIPKGNMPNDPHATSGSEGLEGLGIKTYICMRGVDKLALFFYLALSIYDRLRGKTGLCTLSV